MRRRAPPCRQYSSDVVGFFDDPVDRRTRRALGLLADHAEYSLQPSNLTFGLHEMRLETLLERRIGRLFNHFRERLGDLVLCIINVL